MSASDKERHRDRDPGHRQEREPERPDAERVFRMTHDERQTIAKALRFIDEAREELQVQQRRENREVIRELKASADTIFEVLNGLEETD